MSEHVAVIGAGIIGLSCAMQLVEAGYSVTIIDPNEAGSEAAASFGNAGWLSTQSILPPALPGVWKKLPSYVLDPLGPLAIDWKQAVKASPWLLRYLMSGWTWEKVEKTALEISHLISDAPALHKEQARCAGCAELIDDDGVLIAYRDQAAFEAEARIWALRKKAGIKWQGFGGAELRDLEPMLPSHYGFGIKVLGAGRCKDPGLYLKSLAAYLTLRGVNFLKAKAIGFVFQDVHLQAVVTDSGALACDRAVIAAGIHAKALAKSLGDTLPLESERGYHVRFANVDSGLKHAFLAGGASMIVHQMEGGLRAAGQVEIAGLEAPADWRRAKILKNHLQRLFPNLDLSQGEQWMGHRPSTPDGKPIIDVSARSSQVIYACGHGHIGLMSAVKTAKMVLALISTKLPEFNNTPFKLQR